MIGYAITGSFCTINKSIAMLKNLKEKGMDIIPIMSENAFNTSTRFGDAKYFRELVEKITGKAIINNIIEAEPLGPQYSLDAMVICPCTGNTLAKIANGITDTAVCMAAKAHLRNDKPLIIALASNDALSGNLKNIATLLNRKNVYFVPMVQDDEINKPHSLVADFLLLEKTINCALEGKQYRKLFI